MKLINYITNIAVVVCAILIILSCGKQETPTETQNNAPIIESISTSDLSNIFINSEISIICTASDVNGDKLEITWSAKRGTFPHGNSGGSIKYQTPSSVGNDEITVRVSDGKQAIEGKLTIYIGTNQVSVALQSPINKAIIGTTSPTLRWKQNYDVQSFFLQVASDSSFSPSSILYEKRINAMYTTFSQKTAELKPAETYYWKINVTSYNKDSASSNIWSFKVIANASCPGTPTVFYEGTLYNTIQIGDQCWLKENLNVGKMISSRDEAMNDGKIEKYCIQNSEESCKKYGGLYQWDEAMAFSTSAGSQGICPKDWHIPTLADFNKLAIAVTQDGNTLKNIDEGNYSASGTGTNTSGFSALLSGWRSQTGDLNSGYTSFWSSTTNEADAQFAYYLRLTDGDHSISQFYYYKNNGFGVRCIKD